MQVEAGTVAEAIWLASVNLVAQTCPGWSCHVKMVSKLSLNQNQNRYKWFSIGFSFWFQKFWLKTKQLGFWFGKKMA